MNSRAYARIQPALCPEDQLVLLLARGEILDSVREQALALLRGRLDWQVIFQRTLEEEIYPLLYRNLETLGFIQVPAEVRSQLLRLSKINSLRNTILTEELMRVLHLLYRRGIRTVPVKGMALAESLYGDVTLRVCVDTDILIPSGSVAEALYVLRNEGYESEFTSRFFADVLLRHDIECALRRTDRELSYLLELHWGVSWGARSDRRAMDDLWAEARPATVFGAPAYSLSPEWQVLFLAAHAARHQWQGLKWLVDIHELCSSAGIDWPKVKAKAARWGWDEMLGITLRACHVLFETRLPVNVAPAGLPSWIRLFPDRSSPSVDDAFFATRFLQGITEKLRYAARVFFIPTLAEQRVLRLPSFLEFLYYPIRPLRLLGKWSWVLLRSVPSIIARANG